MGADKKLQIWKYTDGKKWMISESASDAQLDAPVNGVAWVRVRGRQRRKETLRFVVRLLILEDLMNLLLLLLKIEQLEFGS